jgi:hypothetical protein
MARRRFLCPFGPLCALAVACHTTVRGGLMAGQCAAGFAVPGRRYNEL